jgi:hypothetical protein
LDGISAENFLLDQFPMKYRPLIPTTLKSAYSAAAMLVRAEPILQVASAEDNRGRIISWAVDLGPSISGRRSRAVDLGPSISGRRSRD